MLSTDRIVQKGGTKNAQGLEIYTREGIRNLHFADMSAMREGGEPMSANVEKKFCPQKVCVCSHLSEISPNY